MRSFSPSFTLTCTLTVSPGWMRGRSERSRLASSWSMMWLMWAPGPAVPHGHGSNIPRRGVNQCIGIGGEGKGSFAAIALPAFRLRPIPILRMLHLPGAPLGGAVQLSHLLAQKGGPEVG